MTLLSASMAVQIPFNVSGTARAPSVQLSTSCLSFGSLAAKESLAKAVYIHNQADLPIYFEFVTDQQGVFGFDRVHGSVAAQSSACVTVTFQPKDAFNFWRRITCLIRVSSNLLSCHRSHSPGMCAGIHNNHHQQNCVVILASCFTMCVLPTPCISAVQALSVHNVLCACRTVMYALPTSRHMFHMLAAKVDAFCCVFSLHLHVLASMRASTH